MATFDPASGDALASDSQRLATFPGARLHLQQRCFATLAHELGNASSPVALIADVVAAGRSVQAAPAAGTLRSVSVALARLSTVCRLLRGNADSGTLAPGSQSDASAWWSLCAPFVEDMLPTGASINACITPAALQPHQCEALFWAALAIARYAGNTRPAMLSLVVTGETSHRGDVFELRITADTERQAVVPRTTRQLLSIAAWEARQLAGRLHTLDTPAQLACRVTIPPPATAPSQIVS